MLLALDGMGHYPTADIAKKWSSVSAGTGDYTDISITAEGRFGNCIKWYAAYADSNRNGTVSMAGRVTRTGVWSPTTGGVMGAAFKFDDLKAVSGSAADGGGTPYGLIEIIEGSIQHLALQIEQNGTMSLRVRGPYTGSTLLARTAEIFQDNSWTYLEMKWTIDSTAGTVVVKADGMEFLNVTDRTRNNVPGQTNLGVWNAVRLFRFAPGGPANPSNGCTVRMCDFYLADLESAETDDVSDFLGDGTIDKIRPNGVGDTVGWTPLTGANWENVNDDDAHDGDTTYNSATTPGTIDIHQYEDVPADAVILATQHVILARKVDEGVSTVTPQCKINTTTFEYVEQGVPDVTYSRYLLQPIDISPDTGAKFTAAELNGAQFGVEKTS